MKQIIFVLATLWLICLFCTGCSPATVMPAVMAEEVAVQQMSNNMNQEVDIDAAGAVALFLKQPHASKNVQVIKIRRSGFVFLLSVAGKVPTTSNTEHK